MRKDRHDHCRVISGKWNKQDWDAFIATREADLAELDKKEPTTPERLYPRAKGATGPTVDDFALALIQGGYYVYLAQTGQGEFREETLFSSAAMLKAESDRRRS